MLSSKNQSKGTKLSVSGSSAKIDHPRLGVNKAAAAKTAAPAGPVKSAPRTEKAVEPKHERVPKTSSSGGNSGKLIKLIIVVVVVIIVAGAAWWFLGGKPSAPPAGGEPTLPQRAALPPTIEYAHDDIQITYQVGLPVEGTYIVLGFNPWEQNRRRFSDGHISLLPMARAEELFKQYGNLYDAEGDAAGMQAIRNAALNMPYIYDATKTPGVTAGLQGIAARFNPGGYVAVNIKGHFLTYEKGSLNGHDMPAPQEQSGAPFNFVNLEAITLIDNDWTNKPAADEPAPGE